MNEQSQQRGCVTILSTALQKLFTASTQPVTRLQGYGGFSKRGIYRPLDYWARRQIVEHLPSRRRMDPVRAELYSVQGRGDPCCVEKGCLTRASICKCDDCHQFF